LLFKKCQTNLKRKTVLCLSLFRTSLLNSNRTRPDHPIATSLNPELIKFVPEEFWQRRKGTSYIRRNTKEPHNFKQEIKIFNRQLKLFVKCNELMSRHIRNNYQYEVLRPQMPMKFPDSSILRVTLCRCIFGIKDQSMHCEKLQMS
jgi:hypothetical protein